MSTQQRRPAISPKGQHPVESLMTAPAEAHPAAPAPAAPREATPPPAATPETVTTQFNSRISVEHRRALEDATLVLSAKRGRRLTLRDVIEEAIDGLRIANDLAPVRTPEQR